VVLHGRNHNQNPSGIGFANLNYALLAVAKVGFQIDRPVTNDFFSLSGQDLMSRQMVNVLFVPIELEWWHWSYFTS
jgi:hypothetical protein